MLLLRIQNHHQVKGISMNNKVRIIAIVILVVLYDMVEFLYYGVDEGTRICLLIGERCFRADSFVYFASVKVQYIIFAVILQMLVPMIMKGLERPLKFILIANVLYFVEYFFSYNEPISKIHLPFGLYIPIDSAAVKVAAWCYLSYEVVRKLFFTEE